MVTGVSARGVIHLYVVRNGVQARASLDRARLSIKIDQAKSLEDGGLNLYGLCQLKAYGSSGGCREVRRTTSMPKGARVVISSPYPSHWVAGKAGGAALTFIGGFGLLGMNR